MFCYFEKSCRSKYLTTNLASTTTHFLIYLLLQFFASKKRRKCLSPGLKSKRIEKDGKATVGGSPSAKGSLENFLVTSEEKNMPSLSTSDFPFGRAPIKRNLTLEISSSFKLVEKEPLLSAEGHSGKLDDVAVAIAGDIKDSTAIEEAAEVVNSELKQFATNFLSLYCRYCLCFRGDLIFWQTY